MEIFDNMRDVLELATNATTFINEILKLKANNKNQDEEKAIISSKCNSAQIGSSGDYAQIGSSGDYAKIGSSGDYAKIGSSGYYAQIGSSGDYAKIGSSGYSAKIGSSGYSAQIGSSGYSAQIGSSGYYAKIGSSGDYAKIGSSGDSAQIDCTGQDAVISGIGFRSIAKGKKGSWLTLAEYQRNGNYNGNTVWKVDFVKTEQIDGERIKEDTYYTLYNHAFTEVEIIDNVSTIILNRKKNVIKGLYLDSLKPCFVVEKDGIYSHGDTLKEAKESLIYKISDRDKSMYEDYTLDTVVTFEDAVKMYRVITGACEAGTRNFVQGLSKKKKKYTVAEIIKETQGQYGNDTFKGFFERG